MRSSSLHGPPTQIRTNHRRRYSMSKNRFLNQALATKNNTSLPTSGKTPRDRRRVRTEESNSSARAHSLSERLRTRLRTRRSRGRTERAGVHAEQLLLAVVRPRDSAQTLAAGLPRMKPPRRPRLESLRETVPRALEPEIPKTVPSAAPPPAAPRVGRANSSLPQNATFL